MLKDECNIIPEVFFIYIFRNAFGLVNYQKLSFLNAQRLAN